jgi:hypothetical protein
MNKKMKTILLVLISFAIVGIVGYYYVMHGGERNIGDEKTEFTATSSSINAEFAANVDAANKKYLEKPIEITGTITAINDLEIVIDNSIICNLKVTDESLKKDQKVTVKGRVVGFDDLMSELKLDQCFINK